MASLFSAIFVFSWPSSQSLLLSSSKASTVSFAVKKSSRNEKLMVSRSHKSKEDLCRDLREFTRMVGLQENRVPSLKELCQHGRKDLANVVRRRGYKQIAEIMLKMTDSDYNVGWSQKLWLPITKEQSDQQESSEQGINEGPPLDNEAFLWNNDLHKVNGFAGSSSDLEGASSYQYERTVNFTQDSHPGTLEEIDYDNDFLLSKVAEMDLGKVEGQVKIDRLKALLSQRETELCKLKQQIEEEKITLAILETKAENKCETFQEMISAKDEELCMLERSLDGLRQVQVEYRGHGETVELAGSFNGWQCHVKMDVHPLFETKNSSRSRNSLWSTVLWLYPGCYEIKFVVDGHWRIDPSKEASSKGHMLNNILRID